MDVCGYDHCDRPARLYACGLRCAEHTPAREEGRPEPPVTGRPWWIRADGTVIPPAPLNANWVQDTRATARGQRVSGERRRQAHAAEAYEGSTIKW